MTITQLKRHMDRRFDRLERTKADKRDLRGFATNKGLRRFATKKNLGRFATRKDLRRFATRKGLRRLATRTDRQFIALRREMRAWATDIKRYFDVVAEGLHEEIRRVADGVADVNAIKLRGLHHDKVLDEHETRITALERNA